MTVLPELHIDFETRSAIDLRKAGVHVYAEHPSTDVWCACWLELHPDGTEVPGEWRLGDPVPPTILRAVAEGWVIYAHNAGFECELWNGPLVRKHGWPAVAFEQFECTAAMAAAMSLPRSLDGAARAVGLAFGKDHKGKRIMLQMCRPRSVVGDVILWWDVPAKVEALVAYCHQDVKVEHALVASLRPLSAYERRVWKLDHAINQRGVRVDLVKVRQAKAVVKEEAERLNRELAALTDYQVKKASDTSKLATWLLAYNVDLESLDKATVKDTLARTLPPKAKRVLEIRQEAGRSSLAKLDAFEGRTQADGRARGNLLYHGAGTGRWSGVGIQLQNLMRPWMKPRDIEAAIDALGAPDAADWLQLWGKPLDVVANVMRGFVVAEPGHELVRADFSNIEGRVLAWLAGEQWKLDAFRAYDRGVGPDLYLVAAAAIFGVPVASLGPDSPERMPGKVSELAQGYQGGHGAWISMGANYGIRPAQVARIVKAATPAARWGIAADGFEANNRFELGKDEWVALRVVIDGWRAAHPATADRETGLWKRLEEAAFSAVLNPRRGYSVGPIGFVSTKTVLWCRLPSGRLLAYADPKIRDVETPWGDLRPAVTYLGVNSLTKRWERQNAYGGLWAENVTQATARDIMVEAMFRVEARGWPVVLTVHDEIVSEVRKGSVTTAEFGEEMRRLPSWAAGLPVAAVGVASGRYGK